MHTPPSYQWTQHTSAKKPQPVIQAVESVNFEALSIAAVALLPTSKTCQVNRDTYTFGGVNIVFELSFDDGTFWLARIMLPDASYPTDGKCQPLESEVATLQFLRQNTTIPIPRVYGYDANFGNEVGMPYILMEALPGKRLWGGGFSDFIPDEYKLHVYRQIADILVQLYEHPFKEIGMLFTCEGNPDHYHVGSIFDAQYRFSPYGPFTTSLEFYQTRAHLLNAHRPPDPPSLPDTVIPHKQEPDVVAYIVTKEYNCGPFFLTHPDFQITNFLFDNNFNITGVIDWSGCQTTPLESFANPPEKIIPRADNFQEGKARAGVLSPELRKQWAERREKFLRILENVEIERSGISIITSTMRSDRSQLAMFLNLEGILGLKAYLPRREVANLKASKNIICMPNALDLHGRLIYLTFKSTLPTPLATNWKGVQKSLGDWINSIKPATLFAEVETKSDKSDDETKHLSPSTIQALKSFLNQNRKCQRVGKYQKPQFNTNSSKFCVYY